MSIEFEAKFLNVDADKVRGILKKIGAKLVHDEKIYYRAVFFRCTNEVKGFARVRNEDGNVTMTVKTYEDPKYPKEYEVSINEDFKTGVSFLTALGIPQKAFQETIREKWSHPLVHEITFDTVPGLPTYTEIDCTSEESLNKMIDLLELDKENMRFGAFDATYEEYYGITKEKINDKTISLSFKNILNEIKPRFNEDLLQKVYKLQLQQYNKLINKIKRTKPKSKKSKGSKKIKRSKKSRRSKKSKKL